MHAAQDFVPGIRIAQNAVPPGPNSLKNLAMFQKYVAHTNYAGLFGITLARGHGAYIEDVDGNVFLDCLAGASANILGYGCKDVADAYHHAALAMQHSCVPYSLNEHVAPLAKILVEHFPRHNGDRQQCIFGLSGSDGVGAALRAMRKYTGRFGVLYFNNAYHGSTALSQQASGFSTLKAGLYPPSVNFVSLDFPYWDPLDAAGSKRRMMDALEQIETHLKTGRIGGLISEPVQGDGGVHFPCPGFFTAVKSLLKSYGAVLIIDEVQSGMGRTGAFWAIEHEDVIPDIIVCAKGLSAGFAPISAAVGRREVLQTLNPAQQIFTYSGHGPSCAAAQTTIQTIQRHGLVSNAKQQGDRLLAGLRDLQSDYPQVIKDVRGIGLMIGVEIATQSNPWAAKVFATRGAQLGVYFGFFGNDNQVVRIEPPLVIGEDNVREILDVTARVADEMARDKIPEIAYKNAMKYAIGL